MKDINIKHLACLALDSSENDDKWKKAMEEASVWLVPRFLFVRSLIHRHPIYPEKLWDEFKTSLLEDFLRQFPARITESNAYAYINQILNDEGKTGRLFKNESRC